MSQNVALWGCGGNMVGGMWARVFGMVQPMRVWSLSSAIANDLQPAENFLSRREATPTPKILTGQRAVNPLRKNYIQSQRYGSLTALKKTRVMYGPTPPSVVGAHLVVLTFFGHKRIMVAGKTGVASVDLALDLTRTSGRAAKSVSVEIVRELTSADLALLEMERGIKPSAIKRLRDSHHALARLVAEGRSGSEISFITGYSQSRISILKSDPTFAELVSFYRSNLEQIRNDTFADGLAKMAAVRNDLIEELHDRVLDAPETLSTDQILDGIKVTSDRSGLGPQSKSTNVNVNLDLAARVAAGRQRVERLSAALGADNPGQCSILPALTGEAIKDE